MINRTLEHPELGVRMLSHTLDRNIKTALASFKNTGQLRGGDTVEIDYKYDQFIFKKIVEDNDRLIKP